MKFIETPLAGAYVIDVEPIRDARGFFARTWSREAFAARGLVTAVEQCSISFNPRRRTLRGMHYQAEPHAETKIVRCLRGSIYDVIVDLRPTSATFRHWFGIDLTAENRRMLYIPKGMAHGFLTRQEETEVCYQMAEPHVADAARGVRWNDPAFGIAWPEPVEVMSERDRSYANFEA